MRDVRADNRILRDNFFPVLFVLLYYDLTYHVVRAFYLKLAKQTSDICTSIAD